MSYTYPKKFVRDNVIAPFLQLSVVIVTLSFHNGGGPEIPPTK